MKFASLLIKGQKKKKKIRFFFFGEASPHMRAEINS